MTATADDRAAASALNAAAALVAICDAWRAAVSARRIESHTAIRRAREICTTASPAGAPKRAGTTADSVEEDAAALVDEVTTASRMRASSNEGLWPIKRLISLACLSDEYRWLP